MSGEVSTQLDRPSMDPATRAAATHYLQRTGNADLLPVLGLDDTPARPVRLPKGVSADVRQEKPVNGHVVRDGKTFCAQCMRRTQADGRCRRQACGGAR